jgi:Fe-S oxidoreductase
MEAKYDFARTYRDQILKCSRCGYCQAVCPAFGATLRPALNARGKMLLLKEVMDGRLDLGDELIETLFQCTTCASCTQGCPSGVKVPEIIKAVRKEMVHIGSCHPAFKGMNEILQKFTNIYGEEQPADLKRERNRKAELIYFIGCVGSYREMESTLDTLNLLDRLQVDYTLIDEVCCSGVLEDVGYSMNQGLVKGNLEAILRLGAKTVITGCPYCFRTFTSKPQYAPLQDQGVRVIHISQFLKDFDLGVRTEKKVTYHDPCDLGRHSGIYEEPRQTIRKIAPHFMEMRHNRAEALCCGAGGGVRGAFPSNSIIMARRRLEEAVETGAEVILTECNSCVHNLSNAKSRYSKFRKQNLEIYNTTVFINRLLEEADRERTP